MKQKSSKEQCEIVLQKYIARSGYCSRRKAEEMIKRGEVMVNDRVAEPGRLIMAGDSVKIGNAVIQVSGDPVYIKLNKPAGFTCTNRKFIGEDNIFDLLDRIDSQVKKTLIIAGRLDKDSRGLLLLTNDGSIAQRITHPSFMHSKKYVVEIFGNNETEKELDSTALKLMDGVKSVVHGKTLKAYKAKYVGNYKFEVILRQGVKRQIREMFKELGFTVKDLVREEVCGVRLGGLKEGAWELFNQSEVKIIGSL